MLLLFGSDLKEEDLVIIQEVIIMTIYHLKKDITE
jgi:hypothetical protein